MNANQVLMSALLISFSTAATQAQDHMGTKPTDHIMMTPAQLKWADSPPGLPPGAKVTVLEGDPSKAGLFTMRIKMPANYRVMPHFHPADEHVTMLEGAGFMGMGDKLDEKAAMELPTGGFAMMKTGSHHYFYTKKECVLQLHGMGPWGITYINPADDPRNKK